MSRADQRAVRRPESGTLLRQQKKEDKLRRIQNAARTLFMSKGYDEATLREIARLADVGLGTLFLYAADKRDLLFLAYNREHETLADIATGFRPSPESFLDNLTSYFRELYKVLGVEPQLSRYILRELTFYTVGTQAKRSAAVRREIVEGIERLVTHAKACDQLSSSESDKLIAQLLFGIFQAEIRRWLADPKPSLTTGVRQLNRMLAMTISGLRMSA